MAHRIYPSVTNQPTRRLAIHGDNIIECERALKLITEATAASPTGPVASASVPEFILDTPEMERWAVRLFPGFGRWKPDILEYLRRIGGVVREAPDVILTETVQGSEQILLAIEYCSALDAGNQAWQRNGRAYSLGRAGVPYLYVTELGGQELDNERKKKATRFPNPAVPFSYASYSIRGSVPSLPVFVPSPAETATGSSNGRNVYGLDEAMRFVSHLLAKRDHQRSATRLLDKTMTLVRQLASRRTRRDSLTPAQWDDALKIVSATGDLIHHLATAIEMPWSKTATIASLTPSAAELIRVASACGVGLTSTNLPLCIIPSSKRRMFAKAVGRLNTPPPAFIEWLARSEHLVIAWVMGFKPGGDDARPDRGLPPLARMLAGDQVDMLTVVYGPAKAATWPILDSDPRHLMEQNGLWEVILELSDAILIDSATHQGVTDTGYLSSHWRPRQEPRTVREPRPILVAPEPTRFTENDVDTALHMIFGRLLQPHSFEGLCNPPGGDWSGLSLLSPDSTAEYRWLSLPRVSGKDSKRPDHVFQFHRTHHRPLLLIIESKENPARLSAGIGVRLIAYVRQLLASPPNVRRRLPSGRWCHTATPFPQQALDFCSAVAFLGPSPGNLACFYQKTRADIVIECHFERGGRECKLVLLPCTRRGEEARTILKTDGVRHPYSIQ